MDFCIIDFETNGLSEHDSVLSISAIKAKLENNTIKKTDAISRYYFSREPENRKATNINGLTKEKIQKLRGSDCQYEMHYIEGDGYYQSVDGDYPTILQFISGCKIVAHNISFDKKYLPCEIADSDLFCTMKTNTDTVAIPRGSGHKWPTLKETAQFYNIKLNGAFHDSATDVKYVFEILKEMLKQGNDELRIFLSTPVTSTFELWNTERILNTFYRQKESQIKTFPDLVKRYTIHSRVGKPVSPAIPLVYSFMEKHTEVSEENVMRGNRRKKVYQINPAHCKWIFLSDLEKLCFAIWQVSEIEYHNSSFYHEIYGMSFEQHLFQLVSHMRKNFQAYTTREIIQKPAIIIANYLNTVVTNTDNKRLPNDPE